MVRFITQYNNMRGDNPFEKGTGWDGADGPWVFHLIRVDASTGSKARYVGEYGYKIENLMDWFDGTDHLNTFRLELVYE